MVKKINNNSFGEVEKADLALVDFSATWCGPCRMLAPVLEELSDELSGKIEFFNVDVDENTQLAQKFGISNIPALILFKNGKETGMQVGFRPKDSVKTWINSML